MMIKKLIYTALMTVSITAIAQDENLSVADRQDASFQLGTGLNFSFNEGAYKFKLGGMLQPAISYEQVEDNDADVFMRAKRTYFNFSGEAVEEKVSFFFQLDVSRSSPLLDAWVGFHPNQNMNIYFGQKQSLGKNRELLIMEDQLQFPNRSILSSSFGESGREFGLFMDYKLGTQDFYFVPQIAITSGDGRSSFGADSRDADLGGFKYATRVDLYPLGEFKEGNDKRIADLSREDEIKILAGAAASFNDGASNQVGAGHGDFELFNKQGGAQLPDYRQLYFDFLAKYKGFSLLGEYAISTATNLNGTYIDIAGTNELDLTQISEYLALGTAMNLQLGYVSSGGYAIDVSYSTTAPEFEENQNSVLMESTASRVGLSKYFKENALKVQLAGTSIDTKVADKTTNTIRAEVLLQLLF